MKKYIRINDQFIRVEYILGFNIHRWYTTDSCFQLEIQMLRGSKIEIFVNSLEWLSKEECLDYFEPIIPKLTNFLNDAMMGKLTEYELEI